MYKIVCKGSIFVEDLEGYGTAEAAIDEITACIEPGIIDADIVEVVRTCDNAVVCWSDVNGESGTDLSPCDKDYDVAMDFLKN